MAARLHITELLDAYRLHLTMERGAQPDTWAHHARTIVAYLSSTGDDVAEAFSPGRAVALLDAYVNGRGLADGTRAQYISHLKLFSAWLTDEGHLERDPFAKVRTPRVHPADVRGVPLAQVGKFLNYATTRPQVWISGWMAYGAGLRATEIASARREWVEPFPPVPTIKVFGKGRKWRTVPLAPLLTNVLDIWLDQDWLRGPGPLVPSQRDDREHVSAAWMSRMLCDALHRCQITQGGHALRHTFAEVLVTECNDLRAVQELLGHESLATTEKFYAGIGKVGARTVEAVVKLPDPRRS